MLDKNVTIKKGSKSYIIIYKFSDIPVTDFVVYEVLYENGIKADKEINMCKCICFTYKCCKVIVYYEKGNAEIIVSAKLDENAVMNLFNEIKKILDQIAEKMKLYVDIAEEILD